MHIYQKQKQTQNKTKHGTFLWMGFNCLKATEHYKEAVYFLRLSSKFPEIPGAHLIDLRRMKGCVI